MIETQHVGYAEASCGRTVKRVYMRGQYAQTGFSVLVEKARELLADLVRVNASGEIYAGRWAASFSTCRDLGLAVLLVDFED